jgi:hypothetical protein
VPWKRIKLGILSAIAGGFVLGIGGRIIMTLIAISEGSVESPTLGGSIEVLLTGIIIGVPARLVFSGLRKYLPFKGLWRGALWGAVLFMILVVFVPEPASSAISGIGSHIIPLTIGLFGLLFIVYGLVMEAVIRRWGSD